MSKRVATVEVIGGDMLFCVYCTCSDAAFKPLYESYDIAQLAIDTGTYKQRTKPTECGDQPDQEADVHPYEMGGRMSFPTTVNREQLWITGFTSLQEYEWDAYSSMNNHLYVPEAPE